jgi:hypothetical protein
MIIRFSTTFPFAHPDCWHYNEGMKKIVANIGGAVTLIEVGAYLD